MRFKEAFGSAYFWLYDHTPLGPVLRKLFPQSPNDSDGDHQIG